MYVEGITTGVASISFTANPGQGCTEGDGQLVSVSSIGSGFRGTFTVDENGAINSTTITHTGSGYRAGAPVIRPSSATTCTTNPNLRVVLSSTIIIVQRGAFGSTPQEHSATANVYRVGSLSFFHVVKVDVRDTIYWQKPFLEPPMQNTIVYEPQTFPNLTRDMCVRSTGGPLKAPPAPPACSTTCAWRRTTTQASRTGGTTT